MLESTHWDNMKKLKFKSNLVTGILSGERTTTWRFFDDKNLSAGDQLSLLDAATGNEFAKAEIVHVNEKQLDQVVPSDFDDKRWVTDVAGMIKHFQPMYQEKIASSSNVKIIAFKLLK